MQREGRGRGERGGGGGEKRGGGEREGVMADCRYGVSTCVWLLSVGDLPVIDATDGFSPSVTALTQGAGRERH